MGHARPVGSAAVVTRPGAAVTIWGAKGKAALKRLGSAKTGTAGTYTFRARSGDVFQARVVAGSIAAPPLCQLITAQLQGIPCINPTANGFVIEGSISICATPQNMWIFEPRIMANSGLYSRAI